MPFIIVVGVEWGLARRKGEEAFEGENESKSVNVLGGRIYI